MTTETRVLIAQARADIRRADTETFQSIATTLVDAVDALLTATANQAVVDQSRVADLETTVRVLADAVVAITDAVSQAAPAILALQDAMANKAVGCRCSLCVGAQTRKHQ